MDSIRIVFIIITVTQSFKKNLSTESTELKPCHLHTFYDRVFFLTTTELPFFLTLQFSSISCYNTIMFSILLPIIYLSFISLGLPDALLGSGWSVIYKELEIPISSAGLISMIISLGTVISSFFSGTVIYHLKTGLTTFLSVFLTAVAIWGFSKSSSLMEFCLWAVPYGLGAGAVDAALNNYVALHYKASHMNFLHCFWGLGVSIGPYIMSFALMKGIGWSKGYFIVSLLQTGIAFLLFMSLPVWNKAEKEHRALPNEKNPGLAEEKPVGTLEAIKIRGVKSGMLTFCVYCALEASTGLWGATWMVLERGISPEKAARWASLFYIGITAGRFLSGLASYKLSPTSLIKTGEIILITGIFLIMIPFLPITMVLGFILTGIGCGPVYPALIHSTPSRFGRKNSQRIIGLEMALAYVGTTSMPPIMGICVEKISPGLFPVLQLVLFGLLVLFSFNVLKIKEKPL